MDDQQPPRRRLRIDPSDLLLEIVSIVIAIILATAVGQFVEQRRSAERTHEALAQVRQEIVRDETRLRAVQPLHHNVQRAFVSAVAATRAERMDFDTLVRTFHRAAPRGFQPFFGSRDAWETAAGSNALAEAPYSVRVPLQRRYAELAELRDENATALQRLEAAPSDAHPNFYFAAYDLSLIFTDTVLIEERLNDDDAAALRALSDDDVR